MNADRHRGWLLFVLLLAGILACGAPEAGPTATQMPTDEPTSTFTPLPLDPSRTLAPPETLAAALTITAMPEQAGTPLPTFTPIEPTLAATLTPSSTPSSAAPTLRPTRTPTASGTKVSATGEAAGPLSFSSHFQWRLSENDPMEAIATVEIFASGGGGGYTYFRDGLEVEGSRFEYSWRACRANPGTLTVTSADGQSLDQTYFERPPCPTPTPPS
jgi:hypothetical protein